MIDDDVMMTRVMTMMMLQVMRQNRAKEAKELLAGRGSEAKKVFQRNSSQGQMIMMTEMMITVVMFRSNELWSGSTGEETQQRRRSQGEWISGASLCQALAPSPRHLE